MRSRPPEIERVAFVGHLDQQRASGRERLIPDPERRQWERQVLEHMTGNDEVESAARHRQLRGFRHEIGNEDFFLLRLHTAFSSRPAAPGRGTRRETPDAPGSGATELQFRYHGRASIAAYSGFRANVTALLCPP
jgi:hypothetical protein